MTDMQAAKIKDVMENAVDLKIPIWWRFDIYETLVRT